MTLENTISYIGVIAYGSQKLIPSINNIYSSYSDIYYAQASLEKVLKTLYFPDKEEIEKDVNLKAKKELEFEKIEFKNLYFNFGKNQKNILDNIDLTICRGEKIGIIGSTGSGKSTFIDIIMGLLKPSEGEIIINGKNLYGNSEEEFIYEWRSIISHVPQSIFITDNSIEENIALGTNRNSIDQRLLVESSKIAEIYDFIVNTKHKFRTQVGERGSRLSGGQKQRIGIARAIYKKPKILIFDEATSALDSHTENKIINNISKLSTNTTLIMIAHRTSTLRFCDQIYQIKNNKLISRGTPEKTFDL